MLTLCSGHKLLIVLFGLLAAIFPVSMTESPASDFISVWTVSRHQDVKESLPFHLPFIMSSRSVLLEFSGILAAMILLRSKIRGI